MPPTPSLMLAGPSIMRGDRDDGEVAVTAVDFAERGAAVARDRKAHRDDQLVGLAGGREHVELEFGGGKDARAALRAQHHLAFERRQRQRNLRARVGVRDRAAHRALVAGLEVADVRQRDRQQRQLGGKLRPGQQLVLRHRGADLDLVAEIADLVELRHAGDVDEQAGIDQAQVEHRDQRLAAGQHARLVAVFGEQRDGLVDAVGPHIVERTRLHRAPPQHRRDIFGLAFRSRRNGGALPSPLWGGVGGGGPRCTTSAGNNYPPPHPSPARGEGADRQSVARRSSN